MKINFKFILFVVLLGSVTNSYGMERVSDEAFVDLQRKTIGTLGFAAGATVAMTVSAAINPDRFFNNIGNVVYPVLSIPSAAYGLAHKNKYIQARTDYLRRYPEKVELVKNWEKSIFFLGFGYGIGSAIFSAYSVEDVIIAETALIPILYIVHLTHQRDEIYTSLARRTRINNRLARRLDSPKIETHKHVAAYAAAAA